eukprot:CAMPEP_0197069272 /NCGR_PEP_ID=MMETSP1384-20130603/192059_1 /TAXON_ID=29189 /ORGANISM="Ammonia sp." /LENGTH=106 /DNA_ID=CAMNT_0042507275 /DNA_START=25 /DNA_END=341 /DNA_ORIENTATION=+
MTIFNRRLREQMQNEQDIEGPPSMRDFDEKSMIAETVVDHRSDQLLVARRPVDALPFPPSHARRIELISNCIKASPQILGKLYRYMVRFHASSDDPNHADISEQNT